MIVTFRRAWKPAKRSSSPLRNLESSAFFCLFVFELVGRPAGCERCRLGRQQFGNADQVVGDQIEHEIGSDLGYAAMFCCSASIFSRARWRPSRKSPSTPATRRP
jgi:hypothetical protein